MPIPFLLVTSIFTIAILDSFKACMTRQALIAIHFALLLWIPLSIYLTFQLLCRQVLGITSASLDPELARTSVDISSRLQNIVVPSAYIHTWFMLSRLLSVLVDFGASPTGNSPTTPLLFGFTNATVMIFLSIFTIIVFGKGLEAWRIDQRLWGHFLDLYRLVMLLAENLASFLHLMIAVFEGRMQVGIIERQ
ncbi:hypothetical protein F5050DRAFT_1720290 [Lentinula boryana]|uniref:Uncharacterized protein n=1 Tax=Lentinula boryana TaxID=40481 RepID=A0ABQ8QTW2_9AGAR|nr:hypothetical protein F5050DRAFT_1720290 [Lentinula boryana]